MPFFKPKTIQGITYSLDHLEPFTFTLEIDDNKSRVVDVEFRCHCFTEDLKAHHTPDFRYEHDGEIRAFDVERHTLSALLPNMITTLGTRSVYLTRGANFFVLKQNPLEGIDGPYLVFFNAIRARKKGVDIIMNIESAYMKPGMAERASPVRFTTLVDKVASGNAIPRGPEQTIKRK